MASTLIDRQPRRASLQENGRPSKKRKTDTKSRELRGKRRKSDEGKRARKGVPSLTMHASPRSTTILRTPTSPALDARQLLQQLTDAMESNDSEAVFRVLEEKERAVVQATMQQLPVEFASRLLDFLQKKICRKSAKTSASLLWLEQLLQSKLSFLLSVSSSACCQRALFIASAFVVCCSCPAPTPPSAKCLIVSTLASKSLIAS